MFDFRYITGVSQRCYTSISEFVEVCIAGIYRSIVVDRNVVDSHRSPSFQYPNAVKWSGWVYTYIHTYSTYIQHMYIYPYLGRGKLLLSLCFSEIVNLYLHLTNLTFLYRSHHPYRHMESTGGRQRKEGDE